MVKLSNGFIPSNLREALTIRAGNKVVPYAGGTDLMVEARPAAYLFLNKLDELKQIREDDGVLHIGPACSYTALLNHGAVPKVLKEAVSRIASPATRNRGTAGGNICNASPKADSVLIFYASDTLLRLSSVSGERVVPIDEFFTGRGKTILREDELLTDIQMPLKGLDNYYYYKVGARRAMAISRVAFVGLFNLENDRISSIAAAFGAVSDTVLRYKEFEKIMLGKTIAEAKSLKETFVSSYESAINPIRGRVSAEYRKQVCMNLLRDFLDVNGI